MAKGDHIYVPTKWPLIQHHGIDMGDGTVIHFFRDKDAASIFDDQPPLVISRTSKEAFANNRKVSVVSYRYCLPPDEVCAVAEYFFNLRYQMLENWPWYNFREFNCEHFATLCKVGRSASRQSDNGDRVQAALIALSTLVESLPF